MHRSLNQLQKDALNHYISYLNSKNNLNLEFIADEKKYKNKFLWYICFQDFNGKNCEIDDLNIEFNTIETKNFNNIKLKLIEII